MGGEMSKQEQCDNCGRFVAWHSLSWNETINSIVCHSCAPAVESTPIDEYADYFEDIQNNGPYNFYYCDD